MKSIGYLVKQELSKEAKNMLEKLNNQEKIINYKKLSFKGGNNVDYYFINFSSLRELFRLIYYGEILIPVAEREQSEFNDIFELLKMYKPKKGSKYKKLKDDLLINAQLLWWKRNGFNAFKNKILPKIILMIIQNMSHQKVVVKKMIVKKMISFIKKLLA